MRKVIDEDSIGKPSSRNAPSGLTASAASGSAWMTAQVVLNKVVTVGAMLVLARILSPADFGRANLATSVGAFISVISPFVLGDVLLSMPRRFREVAGVAFWVGVVSALVLFVLMAIAAPLVESATGKAGVAVCVMMVAFRPACDAVLVVPFAKLRIDLSYRLMSIVDVVVILSATIASIAMAWYGLGSAALIVPPIATLAIRGLVYWGFTLRDIPLRPHVQDVRPVVRRFAIASLGQYINNVLQILELLVLGWVATEAAVGFFGFAFQIATQANGIIAAQLGAVLQPIFAQMQNDPTRQVRAFLRATRLLAAVAVPISIFQAALAIPLFSLLFGSKWDGALGVFIVLSLGQAFMFVSAPAIALIKAQGRFRAYFAWQSVHLSVAVVALSFAARSGGGAALGLAGFIGLQAPPESATPLAVALASVVVWGLSTLVGVWISARPANVTWGEVFRLFRTPWIFALPGAALAFGSWFVMNLFFPPWLSSVVSLALTGPLLLIAAIALTARLEPSTHLDLVAVVRRVIRRPSIGATILRE